MRPRWEARRRERRSRTPGTLSDLDVAWMGLIADEQPATAHVVKTSGMTHGKGMQSYLTMMAVRLMEMHRVLKPTGSIYLHCDPTASHYLKLLMDAVFGARNYRNEIVWKRTAGRSDGHQFGRVHDSILFYASRQAAWNRQYMAHDPGYVDRAYRNHEERGRWRSADLTASGVRFGESGEPWRGIDPGTVGRHWNTPTQGGMNEYIKIHNLIPGWPDAYPGVHERLTPWTPSASFTGRTKVPCPASSVTWSRLKERRSKTCSPTLENWRPAPRRKSATPRKSPGPA